MTPYQKIQAFFVQTIQIQKQKTKFALFLLRVRAKDSKYVCSSIIIVYYSLLLGAKFVCFLTKIARLPYFFCTVKNGEVFNKSAEFSHKKAEKLRI